MSAKNFAVVKILQTEDGAFGLLLGLRMILRRRECNVFFY